jgi:dihydroneopterin aldolase
MDKIIIEGAAFQARVGVSEQERARRQRIVVDLQALLDTRGAAGQDSLQSTVSYVDIHQVVARVIAAKPYCLVETIADDVAAAVLQAFEPLAGVVVRVAKPAALGDRSVRLTAVEITRMKNG